MSKREKLLLRLTSRPAPKDFSWDELVTLMRQCGFESRCNGGSHYVFEHTSGNRFYTSRAHPSGILKAYQVKQAVMALEEAGELNGEEGNG